MWFRDKAHNLKKPSIDRIDNDGDYEYNNSRNLNINSSCINTFEFNDKHIICGGDFIGLSENYKNDSVDFIKIWNKDNYHLSNSLQSLYETKVQKDINEITRISLTTPKFNMPKEKIEVYDNLTNSSENYLIGQDHLFVKEGRMGNLLTKGDQIMIENCNYENPDVNSFGTREFIVVNSIEEQENRVWKINFLEAELDESFQVDELGSLGIDGNTQVISFKVNDESIFDKIAQVGYFSIETYEIVSGEYTETVIGRELIKYNGVIKDSMYNGRFIGCVRGEGQSNGYLPNGGHPNGSKMYFGLSKGHSKGGNVFFTVSNKKLNKLVKVNVFYGFEDNVLKSEFLPYRIYKNDGILQNEDEALKYGLDLLDYRNGQWSEIDFLAHDIYKKELNGNIVFPNQFFVKVELFNTDYLKTSIRIGKLNMYWTNPS